MKLRNKKRLLIILNMMVLFLSILFMEISLPLTGILWILGTFIWLYEDSLGYKEQKEISDFTKEKEGVK